MFNPTLPTYTRAQIDVRDARADIFLEALEAIQRRGRLGTITQALADIDEAYAKVETIDVAERAKLDQL